MECIVSTEDKKTDFGFESVTPKEKTARVGAVFSSVASHYDVMNDAMSFGMHRLWKRFAIGAANLRPGQRVLDLAGGTGDLTQLIHPRIAPGDVWLTDINGDMLAEGADNMLDRGIHDRLHIVQASAEALPYTDHFFDRIFISFGLRNVTDKDKALEEMYRVLRPGGMLLILEFSHPEWLGLKPIYDAYSFGILPKLGQMIAGDADSYRYLAESIRKHPDQESLLAMMLIAGFEDSRYHNLSGGIVALHKGFKY